MAELREEEQLGPVLDAVEARELQVRHGRGARVEVLEVRSLDVEIAIQRIALECARRAPQLELRRQPIGAVSARAVAQLHHVGLRVVARELRGEDRRGIAPALPPLTNTCFGSVYCCVTQSMTRCELARPRYAMVEVLAVAGFEALRAHAEVNVGRAVRREARS